MPGEAKLAWRGPEGASLVVFQSLPIPDPSAPALSEETAARWRNLPGLTVRSAATIRLGPVEAARVEAVAPGLGDRWVSTGTGEPATPEGRTLVLTHRVLILVPRPNGTLSLIWHFPESARITLEPQVDQTLRNLSFLRND